MYEMHFAVPMAGAVLNPINTRLDANTIATEIRDEWDPITLNYTSGTTSAPKGVVYSHRGAYLSTLSLILGWEMGCEPVYLWSLPMFHCNGWTFTWGIAARGGTNGYFKDEKATAEAFKDGKWFATGDVGVVHPDGYVEIKDRSKDVIISGGENISSVEVESVLYRYPKVVEAAVVAMPHPVWGESPCAFVAAKTAAAEEAEILNFCRKNMAHFMVPKKVVFMSELPKTATGKIQKGLLREAAKKVVDAALEEEKKRKINKNAAVGRKKVVNGGGGGGGGQGGVNVNGSMPGYGSRPHEHILALSRL
ncbi:Butyrate--CoA ligase AAE11, peroxisomal [Linum perenne]